MQIDWLHTLLQGGKLTTPVTGTPYRSDHGFVCIGMVYGGNFSITGNITGNMIYVAR